MINHLIFINAQHNTCRCNMFRCMHFAYSKYKIMQLIQNLSPQLENSYLMTGEEPNSFHLMEDWVVGVINCITAVDISHCQKGI